MKEKKNMLFAIITIVLFLFVTIQNTKIIVNDQSQQVSLKLSSTIPTANAAWEIYGFPCYSDICGNNNNGHMCFWDSNNGFSNNCDNYN